MNATRLATAILVALLPLAAVAETPIREDRPLAADARVEVNNMAGEIRIVGSDREGIEIRGSIGEGAKGLIVEGDEKRLRIRVDYPESRGGWGGWFGGGSVGDSRLEISLPRGVSLELGSVSANIDVRSVGGQRLKVEIDAVSGDVTLRLEGSKLVDIETVSGDAEVQGSLSGRLKAQAVSGDLVFRLADNALADTSISAVSGDVRLQAALAKDGRLSVNSLSGDVEIDLPASTSASLRIETFSGSIRSDQGKVEKEQYGPGARLSTTLGGGEGQIRLESFSGNVELRTR
jgi:DUF4097 and DUF4098 domain-containing protein YvlB